MDPMLYDELARFEDTHWWFAGRRAVIREVLNKHLPARNERRILDVGCGTGGMLHLLADYGSVEGLEGSPIAVAYGRQRVGSVAKIRQGELPGGLEENERFDLISAFDVLEHLEEPVATLERIRRALAPGGSLVCTVPAYPFLWSHHDEVAHHFRRYTESTLRAHLSEGGFEVRHLSYFNSILFAPIAAVRLVQRLVKTKKPSPGKTDFTATPSFLNGVLTALLASERRWVAQGRLPVGVSLLAVAEPR